ARSTHVIARSRPRGETRAPGSAPNVQWPRVGSDWSRTTAPSDVRLETPRQPISFCSPLQGPAGTGAVKRPRYPSHQRNRGDPPGVAEGMTRYVCAMIFHRRAGIGSVGSSTIVGDSWTSQPVRLQGTIPPGQRSFSLVSTVIGVEALTSAAYVQVAPL